MESSEGAAAASPMQQVGDLPDGRKLFYADDSFESPGYYVWDEDRRENVKVAFSPAPLEDADLGTFEVYPQRSGVPQSIGELTGEWGWRLKATNGATTGVGGEGFDSKENARRAVDGVVRSLAAMLGMPAPDALERVRCIEVEA